MKLSSKIYNERYLYQYLSTVAGSFAVLSFGVNLGWTSPYNPQIINGTFPDITMTSEEGSWIAVMPPLATPVGAVIGALLVDRIGRKHTTLLMAPFTLAMFILLAFAKSVILIGFSRFVIGVAEGTLYTTLPMYLGEISDPAIRGILTASIGFAVLLGTLLINVFGFYFSIFVTSLACCLIPIIHFFTFMWMPESPYYLIKKKRYDEARKALEVLRGAMDIEGEMKSLCDAVTRQEADEKASWTDIFTIKSNRRAAFIFVILCLTRKFSGNNPFLFYTATIFHAAGGSLDPNLSVIIFLCTQIVAATVALDLLDRFGRRPMIIAATVVVVIALAVIASYFYLQAIASPIIAHLGWLPLTVLAMYIIFYNLGLELSPIVYLGELFPTNVKATALGFAETFSAIFSIFTAKIFQILNDSYGMYVPFWMFSSCCVIGLIFIIKCVPETKNKTLEEIQMELIKSSAITNDEEMCTKL
ncbi:hypothetical protein PPYR_10267 [Photinus pyralis]|uniref:Major facilitator superfamily (MFS) profile domain-containing protein n=2 Tax=Photinus pyralis TaxID=7054 RepID=A0A1Y1N7V2_PHOPY|nr:facilitated trehalose transporter Tret1-2 homolog [Photinus pyralis]KAB0796206.1 hypothetical protein PPYR_10267 [Photinus pyralis]